MGGDGSDVLIRARKREFVFNKENTPIGQPHIPSYTKYGTKYSTAFMFISEHSATITNATPDSVRTVASLALPVASRYTRTHRKATSTRIACRPKGQILRP